MAKAFSNFLNSLSQVAAKFNTVFTAVGQRLSSFASNLSKSQGPGGSQNNLWNRMGATLSSINKSLATAGGYKQPQGRLNPQAPNPYYPFPNPFPQPRGRQPAPYAPSVGQRLAGAFNIASSGLSYAASGQSARMIRRGRRMAQVGRRRGFGMQARGAAQAAYGNVVAGGQAAARGNNIQSFGSLLGAGGSLADMIPVVGPVTKSIFDFGKTIFDSVDKLQKWTKNLHEANMQWAKFSPAMAQVEIRQQMRDFYYGLERGNVRAGSAEELAQAHSRLRQNLASTEDVGALFYNKAGTMLSNMVSSLVEIAGWDDIMKELRDWLGGDEAKKGVLAMDVMAKAEDSLNRALQNAPPRWPPRR
jgi:hypothetical protein